MMTHAELVERCARLERELCECKNALVASSSTPAPALAEPVKPAPLPPRAAHRRFDAPRVAKFLDDLLASPEMWQLLTVRGIRRRLEDHMGWPRYASYPFRGEIQKMIFVSCDKHVQYWTCHRCTVRNYGVMMRKCTTCFTKRVVRASDKRRQVQLMEICEYQRENTTSTKA